MVSFSHLVKRSCLIESVFSDLMLEKLTSGTSSTGNPNFMPGCTCQKCTQLSSSSSVQSTSITPTTSVSSVTNMTAPPSSSIPSQFGANTGDNFVLLFANTTCLDRSKLRKLLKTIIQKQISMLWSTFNP